MNPEMLKAIYGTDDTEEILKSKETGKQVKSFSAGETKGISLTAEEVKKLCKQANNIEYHPGYENRIRQYTISTEDVDRHGDIVRAKGAIFDNYKKNPVVQFAHDYSLPPVGVSLKTWIDKQENNVKSWALFFGDEVDTSGRSDLVFRYVKANAMNACSIGFNPVDARRPDEKEREKLGMGNWGIIFEKWDLMEFSPVPVPANQNAIQNSFVNNDDFRKHLKSILTGGEFTNKDVDVLRETPIFDDWIIDEFIKELDGPKYHNGIDLSALVDDAVNGTDDLCGKQKPKPKPKDVDNSDNVVKTEIEIGVNEIRSLLKEIKDGAYPSPVINIDVKGINDSISEIVEKLNSSVESVINKMNEILSSLQKAAEQKDGSDLYDISTLDSFKNIKL